jgi:hypothetical protein
VGGASELSGRVAVEAYSRFIEKVHPVRDARTAEMAATFAKVADELHRQYALGFEPSKLDGKSHRLEVKVKRPGLTVRARRSYFAQKSGEL